MSINEDHIITHDAVPLNMTLMIMGWGGAVMDEEHSRQINPHSMVSLVTFTGIPFDAGLRAQGIAEIESGVLMGSEHLGAVAALLRVLAENAGELTLFLHEYDQALQTYRGQDFAPRAPKPSPEAQQ